MPVYSYSQTIIPRYRGRHDALLHEAGCNSATGRPRNLWVIVLTILQTGMI